jgi:DNA ligase 1
MDFNKLAAIFEQLENTSSGNKIREILSNFFKTVPIEDIDIICYLTLGRIRAEYEDNTLGLAEKSLIKAIAKAGAISEKKTKEITQKKGDAGLAAQEILKQKPMTLVPVGILTIHELHEKLKKLSQTIGTGSQEQKINLIVSMLQKTNSSGAKYVTRILLGTLRMGVANMSVLDSLAIAYTQDKSNKHYLETAYNICPDIGIIAKTLAKNNLEGLEKIKIQVGRPIKMMLAQRVSHLEDLKKKMPGIVSVEGKYDGERIQAHKEKSGKITLFSRRLDNNTSQFPDLVKYLKENITADEYIIEGEVLPIDKNGKPLAFQTLMQRRRKYDVEKYIKEVPVQFKVFDILYYNETQFMNKPYEQRAKKIKEIVKDTIHVRVAEKILTDDTNKINIFFKKMLSDGYEGIMIKNLDGVYQAGTRGWNWIKWKKEYVKDMIDTFDLVIVGAFFGKGKRSGKYGALLCAAYNTETDEFETFCKIGTGLTDKTLEELPKKLNQYKLDKKPALLKIKKEMTPDVWFDPQIVCEVSGAEITKSPNHTTASGLALRFPRFLTFREKNADQATTSNEIEEIFEMN